MYANLSVKIGDYESLAAYEVRITNGELVIALDDPEHESSQPVPAGEERVTLSDLPADVVITANF